jgi:hypothetical protein
MDIVRTFEGICDKLGYKFHYGNKSHLNLIDQGGDLEPDLTHFLMFPPTRSKQNNSTSSRDYRGNFFFVRPDKFAQDYYNNTNSNQTNNKYEAKIEPLINQLNTLETQLEYCEDMDVLTFDSIDAVDVLDANLSGLWVTYSVKVYE